MDARDTRTLDVGYAATALLDALLAGRSPRGARRLRVLTKPLLMPLLHARTRAATRERTDLLATGTQAAQLLSWGGDMALLGSGHRVFLSGVGSFAGAHACYIAGFACATPLPHRLSPRSC
ncbi:hypothetical protein BH23ACT9_BH23ACT9_14860 [soil metagenome]